MKRRWFLIPAAILAVFLDSFVLPAVSKSGIRPLFTLSLALAATSVTKVQDAMPIAFFGGLITDLFCNPYVGLSAAAYLVAVAVQFGFTKRGTKLGLVPLFALAASAAAETLIFGFTLVIGGRFDAWLLLRVTLPSIVLEALLTLLFALLFHSREKGGTVHP